MSRSSGKEVRKGIGRGTSMCKAGGAHVRTAWNGSTACGVTGGSGEKSQLREISCKGL